MPTLVALALATPIFGFALQPPIDAMPSLAPPIAMQLAEGAEPTWRALEAAEDPDLRQALQIRLVMADAMTVLGISAAVAMATSLVFAAIDFRDQYGLHGSRSETPCARGDAIFPEYCDGIVLPHAIASGATTGLYVTTSLLGILMPDPLHAGDQPGAHGDRVRTHRTVRWVTSTLMIVQAVLGFLVSYSDELGIDSSQDFELMQGLAIARIATGAAALTSLAVQGSIMLF